MSHIIFAFWSVPDKHFVFCVQEIFKSPEKTCLFAVDPDQNFLMGLLLNHAMDYKVFVGCFQVGGRFPTTKFL